MRGKAFKDIELKDIERVVENNDKKRFELEQKGHHWFIRATQGHSIKSVNTDELLTKITDPELYPTVVHGTYTKVWPLIKA